MKSLLKNNIVVEVAEDFNYLDGAWQTPEIRLGEHTDPSFIVVDANENAVVGKLYINNDFIEIIPKKEVPKEITMRQARLALLGAGKLSAVSQAIISMPEPMRSAANIEWEYSNTVLRHNGFVSQLGPMLGLTEQQIDDLFILANTL